MTNSNDALRAALEWYRDQMCEGFCEGFTPRICAATMSENPTGGDCAGCRAVVALNQPAAPVAGGDLREAVARIIAAGNHGDPWWWKEAFDDGADEIAVRLRKDDMAVADDVLAALNQPAAPVEAVAMPARIPIWDVREVEDCGHRGMKGYEVLLPDGTWTDVAAHDPEDAIATANLDWRAAHPPEPAASTVAQGGGHISDMAKIAEALQPFAACIEQIVDDESDEEWAKFRLTVGDYRRAATAYREATHHKGSSDGQ